MLEDLNTWSNTSDSDREGISSVADRLSKSTGIDINPIGEQARMLAEQERGLTWDTEDDSTSIETRGQDITAEVREFKEDTKERLNKLENWIVAIVGVTITTLIATVGGLIFRVLS